VRCKWQKLDVRQVARRPMLAGQLELMRTAEKWKTRGTEGLWLNKKIQITPPEDQVRRPER
jgi:hypothetical protein